jgi:hypothetical protein
MLEGHIYIYIYIEREREIERDREIERERERERDLSSLQEHLAWSPQLIVLINIYIKAETFN